MLKGLKYLYVRILLQIPVCHKKKLLLPYKTYFSGDPTVETFSFEVYFSESFLSVWLLCVGWFMGFEEIPKTPETHT